MTRDTGDVVHVKTEDTAGNEKVVEVHGVKATKHEPTGVKFVGGGQTEGPVKIVEQRP